MHIDDTQLALRLLVAFGLTFVLGYERQLRGSPAGDRTFSLIGVATGVIGALSANNAPNALAGAVTGIGFIGGGLVFHQAMRNHQVVRGVTTAAAIFATAAIGAAAGEGKFDLAAVATGPGPGRPGDPLPARTARRRRPPMGAQVHPRRRVRPGRPAHGRRRSSASAQPKPAPPTMTGRPASPRELRGTGDP